MVDDIGIYGPISSASEWQSDIATPHGRPGHPVLAPVSVTEAT